MGLHRPVAEIQLAITATSSKLLLHSVDFRRNFTGLRYHPIFSCVPVYTKLQHTWSQIVVVPVQDWFKWFFFFLVTKANERHFESVG
jgi:hypothetical protein